MAEEMCNSSDWADCGAGFYPGFIRPACCLGCPIDTYSSAGADVCTACQSGMFTLGETAVTSSSGCKYPATCKERGNSWFIVNNTKNGGRESICAGGGGGVTGGYSSKEACKNAIVSRMIPPNYTECKEVIYCNPSC